MHLTAFTTAKKNHIALALLCLALPTPLQAAPDRPDAGQIFRESVPPLPPLPLPGENRLQVPREDEQKIPMADGPTVLVRGFAFTGNEHIASDELLREIPAIAKASGDQIDLAGLDAIAGLISKYYREQGYSVATAYVPAQTSTDGIIGITILEGRYDRTTIALTGDKAGYTEERLKKFLDYNLCDNIAPDCQGVVLEKRHIDRALGLVSDLPGLADVAGTLRSGEQIGTSIFQLTAKPGPAWGGQLSSDNYGNRHTGRARGNAALRLNNPLGIGDRLSLDFTTTGDGMNRGSFDYNLPVGFTGWRMGIDYTPSVYVLGAPFDAVDAHGQAHALNSYISYPLIRSIAGNLFLRGGYSYKWLEDDILDTVTKKEEWTVPLSINGNGGDQFFGGGLTGYGLTFTGGSLSFDDSSQAGAEDAQGSFKKINYNLSREQALLSFGSHRFSCYGSLTGQ
ncbi:MAG: hemolysin activation/secretion signal peptide protein, partial [uncultured bacterium]